MTGKLHILVRGDSYQVASYATVLDTLYSRLRSRRHRDPSCCREAARGKPDRWQIQKTRFYSAWIRTIMPELEGGLPIKPSARPPADSVFSVDWSREAFTMSPRLSKATESLRPSCDYTQKASYTEPTDLSIGRVTSSPLYPHLKSTRKS